MEARGKRKVVGEPLGVAGLECINQGVKVAVDFFCEVGCGNFLLVVLFWSVSFALTVFVHRDVKESNDHTSLFNRLLLKVSCLHDLDYFSIEKMRYQLGEKQVRNYWLYEEKEIKEVVNPIGNAESFLLSCL